MVKKHSSIISEIKASFAAGKRGPVKEPVPPVGSNPVVGDDIADGKKSARRWMPVDLEIGQRRLSDRDDHYAADQDYYNGVKMPERRVTGAHETNRDKKGEPGHKPSTVNFEEKPAVTKRR